jgi:hypothetical protein
MVDLKNYSRLLMRQLEYNFASGMLKTRWILFVYRTQNVDIGRNHETKGENSPSVAVIEAQTMHCNIPLDKQDIREWGSMGQNVRMLLNPP